jgi:hypothetical protein
MCYVGHDCLTYNGEPCIFPFKVYGNTYNECSWVDAPDDKAWCSTQVDADGHHLQGKRGICGPRCPIPKYGKSCKRRAIRILTKEKETFCAIVCFSKFYSFVCLWPKSRALAKARVVLVAHT